MSRFSDTVMDHYQDPRNRGLLEAPDRVGVAGVPGQGRFVMLQFALKDGRVAVARFQCHGCGATIASASMLTELIQGKTLDECRSLTVEHLLQALDGLPPDKQHIAGFAMAALRQALKELDPSTSV